MLNELKKRKLPPGQVQVDYWLCHFCGACVGACPENTIFLCNSHLVIDENCTRCMRCITACPLGALSWMALPVEMAG